MGVLHDSEKRYIYFLMFLVIIQYYFYSEEEEKHNLLLQIDSDSNLDIMWGNVGVGNFFIQDSALKQLDFSNVLYNYDCH